MVTAPTNVTASVTEDDITISWDPVTDAQEYNVYRDIDSGSTTSDYTLITTTTNTSYTDVGLLDGEKYYYRVTAVSNFFNWKNFTPQPPHDYDANDSSISGTLHSNLLDGERVLEHDQNNANTTNSSGTFYGCDNSYDLSGISSLNVDTTFDADGIYDKGQIRVNGNVEFDTDTSHGWTARTIDVSGYSGSNPIAFGVRMSQNNGRTINFRVRDAELV